MIGHRRDRRRCGIWRGLVIALPLLGCAGTPAAPVSFAALDYSYLAPLDLAVASLAIDDRTGPASATDIASLAPTPPIEALSRMAQQRLQPSGQAGRAVFVIERASIQRDRDRLLGQFRVRLDIIGPAGETNAFAQASVTRVAAVEPGHLRASLDRLVRRMMDEMNVELEYQIRHTLQDRLSGPRAQNGAVQTQTLDQPADPAGTVAESLPDF